MTNPARLTEATLRRDRAQDGWSCAAAKLGHQRQNQLHTGLKAVGLEHWNCGKRRPLSTARKRAGRVQKPRGRMAFTYAKASINDVQTCPIATVKCR